MLSAFARAFRTPDLRRKLFFTMGIMAIFRLGSFVPTPGVDYGAVRQCVADTAGSSDLLGLVNLFSGGAQACAFGIDAGAIFVGRCESFVEGEGQSGDGGGESETDNGDRRSKRREGPRKIGRVSPWQRHTQE